MSRIYDAPDFGHRMPTENYHHSSRGSRTNHVTLAVLVLSNPSYPNMYRFVALLACAAMLFSGCVDIFIDVIQNPNGSFTLRKMVSIDDSVFEIMQSFQQTMGDTNQISRRAMLDTMENQFAWERDSLLENKAIKWYATRDSAANGKTFILSEVGVDDVVSLGSAANALFRTLDSKRHDADPESSRLAVNCKTTNKGTSLGFYFTPNHQKRSKDDMKMGEQIFGGHALHVRVFSPSIAITKAKDIYPIAGGQQWVVPLSKLMEDKSLAKAKATFVLSGVK